MGLFSFPDAGRRITGCDPPPRDVNYRRRRPDPEARLTSGQTLGRGSAVLCWTQTGLDPVAGFQVAERLLRRLELVDRPVRLLDRDDPARGVDLHHLALDLLLGADDVTVHLRGRALLRERRPAEKSQH